jgi:hypothetical protein
MEGVVRMLKVARLETDLHRLRIHLRASRRSQSNGTRLLAKCGAQPLDVNYAAHVVATDSEI